MPERTVSEVAEKTRHLEMMRTPERWPNWPLLPLKKSADPERKPGAFPKLGVLIESDIEQQRTGKPAPVVYDLSPFVLPSLEELEKATADPLDKYDTFEALYDAGWRVD